MGLAIKSSRTLMEVPKKGQPVVLEARFILTKRVTESMTPAQIRVTATKGTKQKIKDIIKKGIRKEYAASGLKKRSGKLLRAAQFFTLDIRVSGDQIFVKAKWDPKLKYFLAHLFGVKIRITPKMRVFLHANDIIHPRLATKFVKIPKRNFLALRPRVRVEIQNKVFEPAFKVRLEKKLGKAEVTKSKKQIARRTGRRASPFRERQIRQLLGAARAGRTREVSQLTRRLLAGGIRI